MRLTVLGNNGSFPGPGGACSGYLLEHAGQRILIDCGNGVLSRLQLICPVDDLSAVLLSHLHFDHMADLLVLRYGLESRRKLGETLSPLPLYHPETPAEAAGRLAALGLFENHPLSDDLAFEAGPFAVRCARMEHSVECYALAIRAGGRTLAYSGDTLLNPRLAQIARGADVLLCESTLPAEGEPSQGLPHLTSRQAAGAAAEAGVGRLLLIHFWYRQDRAALLEQARAVFANTDLAEEQATYAI